LRNLIVIELFNGHAAVGFGFYSLTLSMTWTLFVAACAIAAGGIAAAAIVFHFGSKALHKATR